MPRGWMSRASVSFSIAWSSRPATSRATHVAGSSPTSAASGPSWEYTVPSTTTTRLGRV